ncbi:MAG: hypothetical protein WBD47_02980, partial [Phormidesmis sp.]
MGKALKGFQDASKEFETEFKKEAERIEKTVAEPMKATLEKPRALAPDAGSESAEADRAKGAIAEADIVETANEVADETASETTGAEAATNSDQAA